MADKNDDVFDGFTLGDLSDMLTPGSGDPKTPKDNFDKNIPDVDPEDLLEEDTDSKDDKEDEDPKKPKSEEKDDLDDSKDDSKDAKDDSIDEDSDDVDKDEPDDDDDVSDLGEHEPDISTFFMERMAEELGWQLGDDEKFESVSDVIDYMQSIVEEASQPQFASNEVQEFNEFVQSGGNLRKFYEDTISGTVDLENIDLEVDENKRSVVREDLRNKGFSESQIAKKIERYENAGVLDEEAEEAQESIKTFREKKAEKLLEEQKKSAAQAEKEQQKFISDVNSYVKTLKDIRGIPVSDMEKKKLLDAIFKADATGQTEYQKVYTDNFAKNLIESAYFTLMGDSIIDKMQRKEKTNAAKDLKRKLKTSKSKRTKQKDDDQDEKVSGGLSLLSNQLM